MFWEQASKQQWSLLHFTLHKSSFFQNRIFILNSSCICSPGTVECIAWMLWYFYREFRLKCKDCRIWPRVYGLQYFSLTQVLDLHQALSFKKPCALTHSKLQEALHQPGQRWNTFLQSKERCFSSVPCLKLPNRYGNVNAFFDWNAKTWGSISSYALLLFLIEHLNNKKEGAVL